MSASAGLAGRFAAHVRRRGPPSDGDLIVVAVSGGLDSVALLHLLRFAPGLPALRLCVGHVDHAMRPGSAADADWVRGLCRAWDIPLEETRLAPPPTSEAAARRARYAFLDSVRDARGARLCATAHHADDQAETVLFRAVRDGDLRGLGGIRERRAPGLWRPLLPFTREEIEAYAAGHGLSWREDPTNLEPYARNVIRHRVLPELEAGVARGVRRALRRLARRAREDEAAWRSLVPLLRERADVRPEPDGFSMDRAGLLELHPAVRARLLRGLAHELGARPSEAGTRLAVAFTSSGASGGGVSLARDVEVGRELGRIVLRRRPTPAPDVALEIPGAGRGHGRARVGGRWLRVSWGGREAPAGRGGEPFSAARLRFPLRVRGREPGDRVRLAYGTKKLKKLLLERRVPPSARAGVALLVDADGTVLWIPGIARSVHAVPIEGEETMTIEIADADAD